MSEHMAAEIRIGGNVPASLVPDLCTVIASQGVSLEWGDGRFHPSTPEDLIGACDDRGDGVRLLWLCDDQARWGEFERLEQFLREHGIAYTRQSAGQYEYDPETVDFRPGHGMVSQVTNAAGQPVVAASELAPLEALLSAALALSENGSAVDCWSLVKTAGRLLREQLPRDLPPLEPLEIERVEDQEEVDGQ